MLGLIVFFSAENIWKHFFVPLNFSLLQIAVKKYTLDSENLSTYILCLMHF